MKKISQMLLGLLAAAALMTGTAVQASTAVALDKAPINVRDVESLQRGAQVFSNYCLSCHGAQAMRFNRLTEIGLSEQQIKDNLLFTGVKVGEQMKVAMQPAESKVWFGAAPPDLSVIARSNGADWLYTYLRSFYRDDTRPTGWNNTVFDKVGMPHVLWELQGEQVLKIEKHGEHEVKKLELVKAGLLTSLKNGKANTTDYDQKVADLTNYLVWMGEPGQTKREQIGYLVLMFLIFLLVPVSYALKKEYWKDVH